MSADRSEQEQVRREKLAAIREQRYPFPNDVAVDTLCSEVAGRVDHGEDEQPQLMTLGGRIVGLRQMGKAAFVHIADRSGKTQLYVRKDEIGDEAFADFKTYDLGDIVEDILAFISRLLGG
mgnify:CR=1 FL=1